MNNSENHIIPETANAISQIQLHAPIVHIEVLQKSSSRLGREDVAKLVLLELERQDMVFGDLILSEFHTPELRDHVEQVAVCDLELGDPSAPLQRVSQGVDLRQARLELHVYREHHDGPGCEDLGEEEEITAATHWLLPSQDFHGLWDSLVMDSEIKSQLLNFVSTSLLFSDKKVNSNLVSWNGVVLLHGPPGTGKTSLCKALAHKLTVRFSNRYLYGQLIEINSHSLFSKWFSESGKLVLKMFQKIQEYIDDPKSLVFVLIDEVESLAHTRTASMGGTEPSDAIRVVNALLTQIDQIRRFPNVIILTTSNVTGAIDLAFVDRADIKQYIGPPSVAAIYQIYFTAIQELLKVGIVAPKESLLPLRQLSLASCVENNHHNAFLRCSLRLMEVAKESEGLSGRTLRKLPFIAHAFYIQTPTVSLDDFLTALSKAVKKQFHDREQLK